VSLKSSKVYNIDKLILSFFFHVRYPHSIAADQEKNPEFTSTLTNRQSTIISQQLFTLRTAISHLRNAYNGMDVEWTDQGKIYKQFLKKKPAHISHLLSSNLQKNHTTAVVRAQAVDLMTTMNPVRV
jgi:hypothetical protein